MFEFILQWLAFAAALPMLSVAVVAVWAATRTHAPGRLRLLLLKATREDLRAFVAFPAALTPRERDEIQGALNAIDARLYGSDWEAIEEEERLAYELTATLFSGSRSRFDPDAVSLRASEAIGHALERFEGRIRATSPARVARRWERWMTLEQARLNGNAVRDLGLKALACLITRAEPPYARWSFIGGVAGLAAWLFASGDGGNVLDFVGTGALLGLFGVLVAMAVAVMREWIDPSWQDVPTINKVLFGLCLVFAVAMFVLLQTGVLPIGVPTEQNH